MISRWQFTLLINNFLLGTTLFVSIQALIQQTQQHAWIIPLWNGCLGLIVSVLWILLMRAHPGKTLAQILQEVWSRPVGTAIALLYFFHFSSIAGWVLHNMSDFMNGTIMRDTPKSVFHIMFLIVACYTVAQGAEGVARLNQLVTPFLFLPFWFVLLLAATINWNWERFLPVYPNEGWSSLFGNFAMLGYPFMETIALTMLYPYVKRSPGRAMVWGIGMAAVSISAILFMIIGLMGVERASRLTFPVYTVVQEVDIGETIVNVQSIISVVLLILIFIKLQVLIYGAHNILQQMFRPKTQWPHLLALTILVSALAVSIYENGVQNGEFIKQYQNLYFSFYGFFLPSLLLLSTWLKNAYRRRNHGNQRRGR